MIKRLLSILIACCFIILISGACSENTYPQKGDKTDVSHVYSVLPGTDEWLDLGSLEARREACYVSVEEADSMTTRALAQTVLDYPFIVDMYAFDSLAEGVETVSARFPALVVLMLRTDAVEALEACAESSTGVLKKTCADTLIGFISRNNGQTAGRTVILNLRAYA